MRPRLLVLTSTYPRWPDDPEPGFVHELSKRLVASFDVHVLCPHAPGSLPTELLDGVTVHRYRYAPESLETLVQGGGIMANLRGDRWKFMLLPGFLVCQLLSTWRLIRRVRPDAIHTHWIVAQGLVVAILRAFRCRVPPALLTSHGGDLFALRGWLMSRIKAWSIRRFDRMTVVSAGALDAALALGATPAMTDIIPMGVDFVERFQPNLPTVRGDDEILFVGRLVEKKGVRHLLRAMPGVLSQRPATRLTIAGYGPDQVELKELARELGVDARVTFLGAVPQVSLPLLYSRAALLVAPFVEASDGDQEGLGLVTIEAIACGCPVLVTTLPGVMDVMDAQRDRAALLSLEELSRLDERIVDRLQNPAAARAHALDLRERLVGRFDWCSVVQRYRTLLGSMVQGAPGSAGGSGVRREHLQP